MKKIKLIAPLFGLATVATVAVPLVSCGNTEKEIKNIRVRLDPVSHNVSMKVNGQKPGKFEPDQDLEIILTSKVAQPIVTDQIQIYVKNTLIPSNWYEVIENNDCQSAIIKLDKQDVFDDITVYAYAGGVYEETFETTNVGPYTNWEDYEKCSGTLPSNLTKGYVENSENMDPKMMLAKDMIYLFNTGMTMALPKFRARKISCAVGDIIKNRSAEFPYAISLSLNVFNSKNEELLLQLKLDNIPFTIENYSGRKNIRLLKLLECACLSSNLDWSFVFSFDFRSFGNIANYHLSVSSEMDKSQAWGQIENMRAWASSTQFVIIKVALVDPALWVHYYDQL